jgi:hypothetical protein
MNKIGFLILFIFTCETIGAQKGYEFPFTQGDVKWKSFRSSGERLSALQIPNDILAGITTKELLITCLESVISEAERLRFVDGGQGRVALWRLGLCFF